MKLTVYLSGEIHTEWRDEVASACTKQNLDIMFLGPVTDHAASDDCGVEIIGAEPDKFWHDHKGAKLNAIRTRTAIGRADVVVVRLVKNTNNGMRLLMLAMPPRLARRLSLCMEVITSMP